MSKYLTLLIFIFYQGIKVYRWWKFQIQNIQGSRDLSKTYKRMSVRYNSLFPTSILQREKKAAPKGLKSLFVFFLFFFLLDSWGNTKQHFVLPFIFSYYILSKVYFFKGKLRRLKRYLTIRKKEIWKNEIVVSLCIYTSEIHFFIYQLK